MGSALSKDPGILRRLDQLWMRLGPDAFVVVDHWEADLCAIGIASPRNHGVLAYVSTWGDLADQFYVELEWPPATEDDFPFQVAGCYDSLNFEQLVRVATEHLARA